MECVYIVVAKYAENQKHIQFVLCDENVSPNSLKSYIFIGDFTSEIFQKLK